MPQVEAPAVLYVDDEPINLRVFEANFRNKFRVLTCQSGSEALAILSTRAHEIGILISDQRMPNMTGIELLERAREIAPDIQRMVITAYADMQAVMDAVNRGQVIRYFVKPWVKEELQSALESSLRVFTLEARLHEIELRMLRSERLATLGQVSAGIAHELLNPVSYISQNVGALRQDVQFLSAYSKSFISAHPNAEVSRGLADIPQMLDDIEAGAQHIREVALGIRSQARGEEATASADLADVAEFASRMARAEVRQRAKLVVEGPQVKVRGGPVRLCQILLNLIVNGAQAIDGADRRGVVEVRWKDGGERIHLTVTDNGRGMAPELQQKLFEPLFTTKPASEGTGLGLSICRELLRAIGGEISLQSTPGVGTTVDVLLAKAA
jgi:signal transduction histidine kinase